MKFSPGYSGLGNPITSNSSISVDYYHNNPHKACKLQKALYGLRQAPRQWFARLSSALQSFGFIQSKSDYSLFTKHQNQHHTSILVYVDDLILVGNHSLTITQSKHFLATQFHIKDLGTLRYFLRIEVDRSLQGIFLSQQKYTTDLLYEYHMQSCKPHLSINVKLHTTATDPLLHPVLYQQLIGKLIYLTLTRPDITFVVHLLSQFMHHPSTNHMQGVKRVLMYLMSNPSQGILLATSSSAALTAYSESDWASYPYTRRSTTGICILLGQSPIS